MNWSVLGLCIIFCNLHLNFANSNSHFTPYTIENIVPEKINTDILRIVIKKQDGTVLYRLKFKKTKGILASHETPVFSFLDDFGNQGRKIKFYQDPQVMRSIGNFSFYHDINNKASAVLFSDKGGTYLDGIISDQIRLNYFPMNYLNDVLNKRGRHIIQDSRGNNGVDNAGNVEKLDENTATKLSSVNNIVQNSIENEKNAQSITYDKETLYPEIVVLLDYKSIMHKAKVDIIKKLLVYWNAVDMLFSSLRSPKLYLNLAAIILPASENSFPFLDDDSYENFLDFYDAMDDIESFFYTYRNQITFDYDLIVAMTGAKLCVTPNSANPVMNCINGFSEALPDTVDKFNDDEMVNTAALLHYDNKVSSYTNAAQKLGYMFAGEFTQKKELKKCSGIMEEYYRKGKFSLNWSTCTQRKFRKYFRSRKAGGMRNFPKYLPEWLKYKQPIENDENIEKNFEPLPEVKPSESSNLSNGWMKNIGNWLFSSKKGSDKSASIYSSKDVENNVLNNSNEITDLPNVTDTPTSLIHEKESSVTNEDLQEESTDPWVLPSVTPSNKTSFENDLTDSVKFNNFYNEFKSEVSYLSEASTEKLEIISSTSSSIETATPAVELPSVETTEVSTLQDLQGATSSQNEVIPTLISSNYEQDSEDIQELKEEVTDPEVNVSSSLDSLLTTAWPSITSTTDSPSDTSQDVDTDQKSRQIKKRISSKVRRRLRNRKLKRLKSSTTFPPATLDMIPLDEDETTTLSSLLSEVTPSYESSIDLETHNIFAASTSESDQQQEFLPEATSTEDQFDATEQNLLETTITTLTKQNLLEITETPDSEDQIVRRKRTYRPTQNNRGFLDDGIQLSASNKALREHELDDAGRLAKSTVSPAFAVQILDDGIQLRASNKALREHEPDDAGRSNFYSRSKRFYMASTEESMVTPSIITVIPTDLSSNELNNDYNILESIVEQYSDQNNSLSSLNASTTPIPILLSRSIIGSQLNNSTELIRNDSEIDSTSVLVPESSESQTQPPCKQKNVEVDVTLELKITANEKKMDVIQQILHGELKNQQNKTVEGTEAVGVEKDNRASVKKVIDFLEKIVD